MVSRVLVIMMLAVQPLLTLRAMPTAATAENAQAASCALAATAESCCMVMGATRCPCTADAPDAPAPPAKAPAPTAPERFIGAATPAPTTASWPSPEAATPRTGSSARTSAARSHNTARALLGNWRT